MSDSLTVSPSKSIAPLAVGLRDAARLLGLSPSTVRQMVAAGELPHVQPGGKGGKLVFRVESLDLWLSAQEAAGALRLRQDTRAGATR